MNADPPDECLEAHSSQIAAEAVEAVHACVKLGFRHALGAPQVNAEAPGDCRGNPRK